MMRKKNNRIGNGEKYSIRLNEAKTRRIKRKEVSNIENVIRDGMTSYISQIRLLFVFFIVESTMCESF